MKKSLFIFCCIISLSCSLGCNQQHAEKKQSAGLQIDELIIGAWQLASRSDDIKTLQIATFKNRPTPTPVYNFEPKNVLVVSLQLSKEIMNRDSFIPISYNYAKGLYESQQDKGHFEIGSWKIIGNHTLIISHIDAETQKLQVKIAKIIEYTHDTIIFEETSYVDKYYKNALYPRKVPKTSYALLRRIL